MSTRNDYENFLSIFLLLHPEQSMTVCSFILSLALQNIISVLRISQV